ncbi:MULTISPECIES: 3-oxoacyl-ACP reductase family protein [unclassified Saccharopolyspora]|uniref:3-oxoacyl-ACP reductase family protein n=1 Tax=unclassified Saccharopolyspora TaxID=2646250 RepID=UPI001CD5A5DF|nr:MULTISPECIES: 3-oxoacyl-ACP reductase family protein [unclassified Saccharopolyspora]MCA1190294.1 3-oxoacyl-ACP reductase FabG [Saccharopolyspora sp. 6T]MCA1196018.1 3-oxoacyl-ACP reductase FabG [Saccharopolyspora sp. 6V]MCA1229357.1 3-oxoacyl-ACP reductase FabG [Saccharopolyspora sp. 6M]MCA1283241.1 3-oxoacyl-ACP reductase FabG [Saccharopolyspora sp. 7B]
MPQPLAGRSALVTGASRGIGAAIARRLAADGAAVALTHSDSAAAAEQVAAEITVSGGRALVLRSDAGDPEQVRAAVTATVAEFGGLDVLVNNAGTVRTGHLDELSLADFDRALAVNVRGPFVAIQEASKHLPAGGRIINVGTSLADHLPFPGKLAYVTSKTALAGLTRGAARDLAPRGITVNDVQPGAVDTAMNPAAGPRAEGLRSATPLGRYGTPEEIASIVAHLASPDAAFVTGATLNADGGFAT